MGLWIGTSLSVNQPDTQILFKFKSFFTHSASHTTKIQIESKKRTQDIPQDKLEHHVIQNTSHILPYIGKNLYD